MKTTARPFPTKLKVALAALVLVGAAAGLWFHFHGAHAAHEPGAHDHSAHAAHDQGAPAATALSLDDGKRWATDQPLRTGMLRIREAVEPVLQAHGQGRVSPEAAKALATSIQENVNYLFANCKLPPKADATLHVLITDLLSGAGRLVEKPGSPEGVALLAGALHKYPEYFDHPGWKPRLP